MYLHPDKAGKESTENFQEISEAARIVFIFLVDNIKLQTRPDTNEGLKVLKCFENDSEVKYNKGNVVFYPDDNIFDAWMTAFEKKFGSPTPMKEKDSLFFKINNLDLPKMQNLGSVTASVWKKPSDGKSKVLIQGKAYMAFLSLVIPDMLKEVEKLALDHVTKEPIPSFVSIEPENNKNMKKSISETSAGVEVEKNKKNKKPTPEGLAVVEVDVKNLTAGFEKLQSEIVSLREDLVRVVDDSVERMKKSIDDLSIKKDLVTLEKAVATNTAELSSLQVKMDKVVLNQQKMKPVDTEALTEFLDNSQTVFTKLNEITSIHMAANEKNIDGQTIVTKLNEMNEVTNTIKTELGELNRRENQANQTAAESSVSILKSIEEKITKLVANANASSQAEPSVRPKEPSLPVVTEATSEETVENPSGEENATNGKQNVRKALFFSSSIGLGCNINFLQDQLKSEIEAIPTYHIEKNTESRNPELNLKENLKRELNTKQDLDFIIISTGTNDISKLNTEEKDTGELITIACDQAKNIVHFANEVSQKYDLDVFVIEKPPRYDSVSKDPNGVYKLLNTASNGLYPSLIAPLKKVHFIPLPSLQNLSEGSMKNLFTDGIHLKNWGIKLLTGEIIRCVQSVYTDIKTEDTRFFQRDGGSNHQNRRFFQQGGGSNSGFKERRNQRSPELGRKLIGDFGYDGQTQHIYRLDESSQQNERRNNGYFNQPGGRKRDHQNERRNSGQISQPDGRERDPEFEGRNNGQFNQPDGRERNHQNEGRNNGQFNQPDGREINHQNERRNNGQFNQPGGRESDQQYERRNEGQMNQPYRRDDSFQPSGAQFSTHGNNNGSHPRKGNRRND